MLYFITSNPQKISNATHFLDPLGVTFEAKNLDVIEIQHHNPNEIVLDKARKAFEIIKQPLFVNDDNWYIPALNNFPGPYMKDISTMLTTDDLLTLMKNKKDRTIILHRLLCFTDGTITKIFEDKTYGKLLHEKKGNATAHLPITSFYENGETIAQRWEKNLQGSDNGIVWQEFGTWYTSSQTH